MKFSASLSLLLARAGCLALLAATNVMPARAAAPPVAVQADYIAHDFRFQTGETVPKLRLHYTTVGAPTGQPVLIIHGTFGSGTGLLTPAFGGELFGPGEPLDAAKYFIILPDNLGAGKSAKPSDGLRTKFPEYDYADMVLAEYRLVTEGLGIRHLRLVLGNSMGGMQTWMWGETYPGFMDALVPMASQPTEMASRNWMMRRMLIETIRSDPEYKGGDYSTEPSSLRALNVLFGIATSGGTLGYQKLDPTHAQADAHVDALLAAPPPSDANDYLYQWNASRDYNAEPGLERIEAPLLAINSADDERNPPETGLMDRAMRRVKTGRLLLIPASGDTRGHGTTGLAHFWAGQLDEFLRTAPQRSM